MKQTDVEMCLNKLLLLPETEETLQERVRIAFDGLRTFCGIKKPKTKAIDACITITQLLSGYTHKGLRKMTNEFLSKYKKSLPDEVYRILTLNAKKMEPGA